MFVFPWGEVARRCFCSGGGKSDMGLLLSTVHIPERINAKWESATGKINIPNGWRSHCTV